MNHRGRQIKDAAGSSCEDGLAQDGRCMNASCKEHRALSTGFRIWAYNHSDYTGTENTVGFRRAVPIDEVDGMFRTLWQLEGTVRVVIESERSWAEAEAEGSMDDDYGVETETCQDWHVRHADTGLDEGVEEG